MNVILNYSPGDWDRLRGIAAVNGVTLETWLRRHLPYPINQVESIVFQKTMPKRKYKKRGAK